MTVDVVTPQSPDSQRPQRIHCPHLLNVSERVLRRRAQLRLLKLRQAAYAASAASALLYTQWPPSSVGLPDKASDPVSPGEDQVTAGGDVAESSDSCVDGF